MTSPKPKRKNSPGALMVWRVYKNQKMPFKINAETCLWSAIKCLKPTLKFYVTPCQPPKNYFNLPSSGKPDKI